MKNTIRFIGLALLACLFWPLSAAGQNISVSSANGDTIDNFVNEHLKGNGVYMFNFKFNNKANKIQYPQIGTFQSNGFEGLYMDSGVVMTTGNVSVAEGPNSGGSTTLQVSSYYTDNQMKTWTGFSVTSCATLDFDFVSISPFVTVNYSFGSEEYPEYVCTSFNDVFAFLVTGPDPETGVSTTWNAAIIPHTVDDDHPDGIEVTINAVNVGTVGSSGGNASQQGCYLEFSDFYVDNQTTGPTATGVEYDGYTQKLSANATIIPCEKYHMHISVCNVSDASYDSGVFLEANSFNSPSAEVNLSHRYPDTLERSKTITLPLTLDETEYDVGHVSVSFGGTANIVQDYTVTTDSGVNLSTLNTTFNLDKNAHWLTFKGTPSADLSQPKLIEVYLATSLCEQYPALKTYDTIRYILVEDDVVRLRHDTIVAYDTCHQVGVEVAVGEPNYFHWMPEDDIDFPYQQYSTAMITESRLYKVAAADAKGHTDTTEVYIEIRPKEGIDDAGEALLPTVWPSVTTGAVHVQVHEATRIDVYSIDGMLVYSRTTEGGMQEVVVDGLPAGVYAFRMADGHGMHVEKVVVQ